MTPRRDTRWTILLDGAPMTREALAAICPPELSNVRRICWERVWRHEFDVAQDLPRSMVLPLLLDVRRALPLGHHLRLVPKLVELHPETLEELT